MTPKAKSVKVTTRVAAPAPRWPARSSQPRPVATAKTAKPMTRATETVLGMSIVRRSLTAA
jgi:hypothetical protein